MRGVSSRFSILILSEDASKAAFDVLKHLSVHMLKQASASLRTNELKFEPLESALANLAVHGCIWKSTSGADARKKVELRKSIANRLLEPSGFVFFHVDGDSNWSTRSCANIDAFNREVVKPVRTLIEGHISKGYPGPVDDVLSKLILIVPYYSIEAWLYQNNIVADAIFDENHGLSGRQLFLEWSTDRQLLDEVEKPKAVCSFGSRFNRRLAETSFPATAVRSVGKSFTAAVKQIEDCTRLMAELYKISNTSNPSN